MEGFDIHRVDLTIPELISRKALPMKSISKVAAPVDLEAGLKCDVCHTLALPDFTWCQRGKDDSHLVCCSCVSKFTSGVTMVACPVMMEGPAVAGNVCLEKLTGFENGIPRHIEHFLCNWRFSCGATKYGCPFIGTVSELQQHEMLHCTYRKLRVCYLPALKDQTGSSCREMCNTYEELNTHLEKHGFDYQHNAESVQHLTFKDVCDLTDKFVVIERNLVDYSNGRFCLLTVSENKTHIRMWLRDLKPAGDPMELPFYSATTPSTKSPDSRCAFRSRIRPYSLTDLEDEDAHVFEVNKDFLRSTADSKQTGNVHFSVIFKFLDNISPKKSP